MNAFNRRGFSLLELIIVMVIAGILLALATLNFSSMQRKYNIESQMRTLQADILEIRQRAMVTRMVHRLQFDANPAVSYVFRRYSTDNDVAGTVVVGSQKAVRYPITLSVWASPTATAIDFSEQGLMRDPIGKSFCVYSTDNPSVDAVVLLPSRVSVGRINDQGVACGRPNIAIR